MQKNFRYFDYVPTLQFAKSLYTVECAINNTVQHNWFNVLILSYWGVVLH